MLLLWSPWDKTKQPHNQKFENTTEKLIHMGLTAFYPWTVGLFLGECRLPCLSNCTTDEKLLPLGHWMCPLHLPICPAICSLPSPFIGESLPHPAGSLTSGPLCHPCRTSAQGHQVGMPSGGEERGEKDSFRQRKVEVLLLKAKWVNLSEVEGLYEWVLRSNTGYVGNSGEPSISGWGDFNLSCR